MIVTKLKQAVDLSLDGKTEGEIDADFIIDVDGMTWNVYTVSISHRDILCYCDKGTATFLVDSYGDRHVPELFGWCLDDL